MKRRFFIKNKNVGYGDSTYFTIEPIEDKLSVQLLYYNDMYYSIDGDAWRKLSAGASTPIINAGQQIHLKINNPIISDSFGIGTFIISKRCNVFGNIMSLLFGDNFEGQTDLSGKKHAFYKLFYNCSTIIDASQLKLPATTLSDMCYSHMFSYCTSLTTAPELPATTLSDMCYSYMFYTCTSLVTAPELPATTLAEGCYSSMFDNCKSLVTAPELPAKTMFESCYYKMFEDCTSLTEAPVLPATMLERFCYSYMFTNCSKLNYIKALFLTEFNNNCTSDWVKGVSSTGTFVKSKDATWNVIGSDGIPSGWTVQTV